VNFLLQKRWTVLVDSFTFLPRSFVPLYEHARPFP